MHVNIEELKAFYQAKLGGLVTNCIVENLGAAWNNIDNQDILSFGYCRPFIEGINSNPRRLINFIPHEIGIERWPTTKPNCTLIGDENNTPFNEACFDKILCVHAIEGAQNPRIMLRELWRILAPEGELIIFVTNRRSTWAQNENTPFGHGRPFSKTQLHKLLDAGLFEVTNTKRLLFIPPIDIGMSDKNAQRLERMGQKLWAAFGGIIMVSAKKRLFLGAQSGVQQPKPKLKAATANILNNNSN